MSLPKIFKIRYTFVFSIADSDLNYNFDFFITKNEETSLTKGSLILSCNAEDGT